MALPEPIPSAQQWVHSYLQPAPLQRPPRLISELLALADAWGWNVEDLARELRVHRTTLLHQRAGRHALQTAMLSRIAKRFRNERIVRDLVWHYLAVEYEERTEGDALPELPRVPERTATMLRAYLDRFSEESVHGARGLYLLSADATLLGVTLRWLQSAFKQRRINAALLRADRPVSASEARFALAAPVLLVERVDFLRDAAADLLRRRADLVRPIVVSSMQPPDVLADAYIRRILTSTTRLIEFGTPPAPSTPPHGPVPAASEQS